MTILDEVAVGLAPLFEEAEKKGLWFYATYQQLWFSPAELRAAQAEGKFRWGAVNWMLRDPQEQVTYLRRQIQEAEGRLASFESRMARS